MVRNVSHKLKYSEANVRRLIRYDKPILVEEFISQLKWGYDLSCPDCRYNRSEDYYKRKAGLEIYITEYWDDKWMNTLKWNNETLYDEAKEFLYQDRLIKIDSYLFKCPKCNKTYNLYDGEFSFLIDDKLNPVKWFILISFAGLISVYSDEMNNYARALKSDVRTVKQKLDLLENEWGYEISPQSMHLVKSRSYNILEWIKKRHLTYPTQKIRRIHMKMWEGNLNREN
ncbi:MAG: hypothetical protein JXQ90_05380 [Cyclobacteriaceae bacterium]